MYVIQPNCRIQFTAEDIDFLVSVLDRDECDPQVLVDLLTDQDSRDHILDDKAVLYAILDHAACLRISSRLYFYVLTRHVLLEAGIDDREATDYLAEMLTVFLQTYRDRSPFSLEGAPLVYLADLLAALQTADKRQRFLLRVQLGNAAMFLVGMFPGFIRHREQRGAPSIDYYEQVGRASYEAASAHYLAECMDLAPVYQRLSDRFHTTRLALNDLSERMMNLQEDPSLNALLLRWT